MTSTRDNPKLPQSTAGITSLGAVGGARGTAAGGLRILVEFLTTYDPSAVKTLQADLATVEAANQKAHASEVYRARKLSTLKKELAGVEFNYKKRASRDVRKEIELQDNLRGNQTKAAKEAVAESQHRLATLLRVEGFTDREITKIQQRHEIRKKIASYERVAALTAKQTHDRTEQQLRTEQNLGRLQKARSQLAPKLTGLAIGAVGGILGGAILNVGWQLAEEAIAKIGDKLQDLIDPARHARESVQELGKAINELTDGGKLTQLEAARKYIEQAGGNIGRGPFQINYLAELTAQVTARQQTVAAMKQEIELLNTLHYKNELGAEDLKTAIELTRLRAQLEGTLTSKRIANPDYTGQYGVPLTILVEYVNGIKLETVAKDQLTVSTDALTDAQYRTANAAQYAANQAAQAAALWNIYAQSLASAVQAAAALQSAGTDAKIAALGDGTSARTRRLQARVNAPSGGGGDGGARARTLANIAEERALLLLKMRLKLLGTNINLEKYSGKFLLVAIEAKIAALQKEGAEQAKINQLLDLRYRQSQTIQRSEGESINDFLARRAQEQRNLLSEEADLRRQNQIDALEERKSNLEDQLALEELAERKREAMRKTGTASHNANLQKQLEASKKADAKALADRKKALEAKQKKDEEAAREAIELTSETSMKETWLAIRGMKTLEDVNKFGGRMAGLLRAKSTIQALVDGFGLPREIASGLLARLQGMINAADAAMDAAERARAGPGGRIRYAEGGVFTLNNSSTPFGQNVQLGEQGNEIGVVLSNKVAQILKQQQGQTGQIGPFIIQQSNDPFRDRARFGRLVTDSIEAALR